MAFGEFAESIGERAEPKDAPEEIPAGLEHLDPQCLQIRRWGKGSGSIDASQISALPGRNESGKSNLLLALRRLNPIEGFAVFNKIRDFPRHRRLEECTDDVKVLVDQLESHKR